MKELPKKYDFISSEENWKKYRQENEIYKFNENSDQPIYSVDTPPPYVSADHLHAGHIMSYSQAEFIVRYKRMRGFNVFYPMGFDDNGLPTERFVEKKYNIDKSKITRSQFVQLCLEETQKGGENYKNLWQNIGVSIDWSKTYSTINSHSQKISQTSFIDLYRKGKIYRSEQPTYWCTFCHCALAQSDLDDKEEKSFLNFIKFGEIDNIEIMIATSRPELLGACIGIFANPLDERYKNIFGKKIKVPLFDFEIEIYSDESVDIKYGTGLMMVCSWGDIEDIAKWKKYNLPSRNIIGKDGKLNSGAGTYSGFILTEARKSITEDLKSNGYMKDQKEIKHILNVHERCGTPVEFIQTKQWFIKLLDNKQDFLNIGDQMNWYPSHMKKKYEDWINGLKWDWCISRDRYYGVPIPVWYCKNCNDIFLPDEKDLPVDPSEMSIHGKKCNSCGCEEFEGEKSVLDTWMSSSVSTKIAGGLINNTKDLYPFSLRPQAFEIIRTWLFYSAVKGFYHDGNIPFKDIMISGHGLDDKGRKISKSLGNYVEPAIILGKYGADALRYWAAGATLGESLRYNEEEIKKGSKLVTKLWNASKFCFTFLQDGDYSKPDKFILKDIDLRIIDKMQKTIIRATDEFEKYEYAKAKNIIDEFFWKDFCDDYIEFIKYRIYQDIDATAAKQTLYHILNNTLKLYAPILPFITEEIYHGFFMEYEKTKSIHISSWPKAFSFPIITPEGFNEINKVIDQIYEIRKYKSLNNLSIGAELEEYKIDEKINEKHYELIMGSCRIKKII